MEQHLRLPIHRQDMRINVCFQHKNIIKLHDVATNAKNQLFLVFPYCQFDLKTILRKHSCLTLAQVKNFLQQLLEGVYVLHDSNVLHRDLKPANILIGDDGILRICDLGSARRSAEDGSHTPGLVTLWYRAPEVLLGARDYSHAVDIWSVGCIFAEMITTRVLFNGSTELEQLNKFCAVLGTPNEDSWPGLDQLPHARSVLIARQQPVNRLREHVPLLSPSGYDLLMKMLTYDPSSRISAADALAHPFFCELPLPAPVGTLPSPDVVYSSPLSGLF